MLTKDGNKYTFYAKSTTTGMPSASLQTENSSKPILKIRFEEED